MAVFFLSAPVRGVTGAIKLKSVFQHSLLLLLPGTIFFLVFKFFMAGRVFWPLRGAPQGGAGPLTQARPSLRSDLRPDVLFLTLTPVASRLATS